MGRPRSTEWPKCLLCGEECSRATTKFCSQKCLGAYRHQNKIKIGGLEKLPRSNCVVCGEECKRSTTITCSRKCYDTSRMKEYVSYNCEQCGCEFVRTLLRPQQFCSTKCSALGRRGRVVSEESRLNMSRAQAGRKAETSFTKGLGGFREDIGHYVRSSWEANIARILAYEGLSYEFEPDVLELKDGTDTIFYKPDFKLKDRYIEVKGWWTEKSLLIRELMSKTDIRIEYIAEKEYRMLQNYYIDKIPNWETDYKRRRSARE